MKAGLAIRDFLIGSAQLLLSLVKILFISKWFVKFPEKKGTSIAFLANGPSLHTALKKMKADGMPENIMVSNFFCKSDLYETLKPNYYIFCDAAFISPSDVRPEIREFYRDLFRKTSWDLVFFVPFVYLKAAEKCIRDLNLSNPHIRLHGYNMTNFNGDNWFNYAFFKWKLGMPRPTTVAAPALMMCLNLGFKSIRIAGIDLNQHQDIRVNEDNKLMLRSVHFYSKEETIIPFYKNKEEGRFYSVSEIFLIFHRFFYSFDIIAKFAAKQGAEIVNYSKESFLDQFKKI
jgi:hypothetical protein